MQSIDADRNIIDRESKLFNYWFFQMGGKSLGATSSSEFFYHTTGIGHNDGVVSMEDDEQRGETGLMSAMEDAGSSNLFALQHSQHAAP